MIARGRAGIARVAAMVVVAAFVVSLPDGVALSAGRRHPPSSIAPHFSKARAFDVSRPLRELRLQDAVGVEFPEIHDERGPVPADKGFSGDGAVQSRMGNRKPVGSTSFEGLSNADNPGPVSPPDPNGEIGPNNVVEIVNLVLAVYDRSGSLQLGPMQLGQVWSGFSITDCADNAGDPVVLYDQLADRWFLSQFTDNGPTYWDCVAVSTTSDPTGSYYRYAFTSDLNFPDYPKYGMMPRAYFLATREFDPNDNFAGDGLYALERKKMIKGDPNARMVKFLLAPGTTPWLPGDGLLPADLDGTRRPPSGGPEYFVGTQDNGGPYGAPSDALNIFQFWISWGSNPTAAFFQSAQLPVEPFDSIFPCLPPPNDRDCIPQPDTTNKIDILSYRQRPTFRLAYRNFGDREVLVTNQSVEARAGIAGVRWYEIRQPGSAPVIYQQGTYAPKDGVDRWMGSIAMDKNGGMGLGYSVSNDTVYPGIRFTGRLKNDPLGKMTLAEGSVIEGSGSQTVSSRWGDYTDMTIDPTDDCTFWYVNMYYETTSAVGWQTRIGSFKLPGC